jgi:hypothetical protein
LRTYGVSSANQEKLTGAEREGRAECHSLSRRTAAIACATSSELASSRHKKKTRRRSAHFGDASFRPITPAAPPASPSVSATAAPAPKLSASESTSSLRGRFVAREICAFALATRGCQEKRAQRERESVCVSVRLEINESAGERCMSMQPRTTHTAKNGRRGVREGWSDAAEQVAVQCCASEAKLAHGCVHLHNSNMSACVLCHSRELRWLRPQQRQQLHQPPPAASSAFPRAWFCPASAAFTVCHYHHYPTCGSTTTCLPWHPVLPPFCTVCTKTALTTCRASSSMAVERDCAAYSEEDRGHCVTRCL